MYAWRHIPIVRILLPFILGIVAAKTALFSAVPIAGMLFFLLVISLVIHRFLRSRIDLFLQKLLSILILVTFFTSGILLTVLHNQKNYASHYSNISQHEGQLLIRILDQPENKEKTVACLAEITQFWDGTQWNKASGKAQLYFPKSKKSRSVRYGDFLLISSTLSPIASPTNPYQFDFASYYANQNIFHQAYLDSSSWISLDSNSSSILWKTSYDLRDHLKSKFKVYFPNKDIRGVAEALVFGYKGELNKDWLAAFSRTGTIHVLAVSGLHVGIIFLLLNLVFSVNNSKGKILVLKSFLIILCLFAYSMLTGFAPSVSRASLMFSTVVVARAFDRRSNIYNTLALSALVLLIVNPFYLFHVGFQFSYLAVLGIVYYKDIFRSWLPAKTWLQDKVSSLLAVSIAAQITTFPLGLYYFHQYPNLFFISNLIVIPCITIILYCSLAAVLVGLFSDNMAIFFSDLSALYIEFISIVVHYIQDIPFAFFDGIHITFLQMLLLYCFVVILTITLQYKWIKGWSILVVVVVSFIMVDLCYAKNLKKNEAVIFDVRNETLVGFKSDNSLVTIASPKVYMNPSTYEYIIEPFLVNERCNMEFQMIPVELSKKSISFKDLKLLGNGLVWHNSKSYLFLDFMNAYVNDTLDVDVLLIGKTKNKRYLKKVLPLIECKQKIYLNNWRNDELTIEKSKSQMKQSRYIVISK